MTPEDQLREKLRKIEALFAGATTAGERFAAGAAAERIRERLNEALRTETEVEHRFSISDTWSRQLFMALCRRYGLRPYRYPRMHRQTIMVRAPESFVDLILWPEFEELDAVLCNWLSERLSFQIVCVDGMFGRNSAPQEGQMDGKRFQDWLAGIDSLSETQRTEALAVLSGQADDVLSLAAVEAKVEEDRRCPHCGTPGAISRGRARGLRRYQCKGCGRTFNAATGTPLSGLHHKERWLTFGASLAEGETVRESASRCGLGVNTAFRWRHRFLAAVGQAPQKLKGIVEVDETYVLESNKGSRTLDRKARRRGGKASKRGLSHEQVPVLVAADRSGTTVSEVLPAVNADTLKAVLEPSVDTDIVLVSDSKSSYRPCAAAMGVRHEALNLSAGERVRDAFHIQTVNSRHSQLKDFLRGYRGIATKYLDSYLNWFHLIGMAEKASPRACLAAAISGPRIQFGN